MIELSPEAFPGIAPLFAGIEHNVALVFGVIEGNSPGRAFVDRPDVPASALIVAGVGYSYVGGSPDSGAFNAALAPLLFDQLLPQMEEQELILFAFADAWRRRLSELLSPRGTITIERQTFAFHPERFAAHAGWRARLPEGTTMRHIDAALAARRPEFAPLLDPRTRRFGVCMTRGDEILSVCTAVSVGGGEAEVDIATDEAHRGQGYGYLTACAFIEECLARGLTPSWACWPFRTASAALARKLGYEPLPDVPAHFWAPEM